MRREVLLLVALAASACGHRRLDRQSMRSYVIAAPGGAWTPAEGGSADHAWYQPDLSAVIYANANCGKRYEDGVLSDLLSHLTFGIAHGDPTEEKPLTIDGRAALQRTWMGQLDGVTVAIAATVVKKDTCLYDLLYIAPPSEFDRGIEDYEAVVGSLRTTGD